MARIDPNEPIDFSSLDPPHKKLLRAIKKIYEFLRLVFTKTFSIIQSIFRWISNLFGNLSRSGRNGYYDLSNKMRVFHPSNPGTVNGLPKAFIAFCALYLGLNVFGNILKNKIHIYNEPLLILMIVVSYMWYKLTITYPGLGFITGGVAYVYYYPEVLQNFGG